MSLTHYLNAPEHSLIRQKIRSEFTRPAFNLKTKIKAPPLTKNYGIIGTAFDYLLRFTIEFHNKNKTIHNIQWLADTSFRTLMKKSKFLSVLQTRYTRAKNNHTKFLKNGRVTSELLADTLFLAKLDLYFRTGMLAPDLFRENPLDLKDLKKLHSTINISNFLFKKKCFLNPTFGKGSSMVGGADADIILDDTLIEIKVTKELSLDRKHLNQLIGYYILAQIGSINNKVDGKLIKRVGIYFARHGALWTIPVLAIGTASKFDSFKNWLVEYFDTKE